MGHWPFMMEKQRAGIYLTAPPGGHSLKQQIVRIVPSRNKNTPIYYVILEETFGLKTTKTRTYLLLILWHKIKVEMLYFVCFLGQLCSTSAQSTSPNKACEANDSLLKFTNTSLFMYHNNLVSEKEAWMFAPLTIHWKNMWMNAYWKYGRSHLSIYIYMSVNTDIYIHIE